MPCKSDNFPLERTRPRPRHRQDSGVSRRHCYGLRDADDTATCLQGYDTTCFPKGSDWTFTRFFAPVAVAAGYKLADDAQVLWNVFEELHNKSNLPGELEIPMESFARTVEITLKSCWDRDPLSLRCGRRH